MPGIDTLSANDPFHLQRFLDAQAGVYAEARGELAEGRKRSHWMWFVFPQLQGLGSSPMAQRYAIADLAEARAYLRHPVLGERLRECTALVNRATQGLDEIFGYPDDLKFHSSITLFAEVDDDPRQVFREALKQRFEGRPDRGTISRLG